MNDNYMTLFLSMLILRKVVILSLSAKYPMTSMRRLDLDKNGILSRSGTNGDNNLIQNGHTRNTVFRHCQPDR